MIKLIKRLIGNRPSKDLDYIGYWLELGLKDNV